MTPEYKAEKEASVSFLGGGHILEVNSVLLAAPAAVLLWSILQTRQNFFKLYTTPAALVDFMLQCCAVLFSLTVYSSSPQVLNGLLILPAIAAYLQPTAKSPEPPKAADKASAKGKATVNKHDDPEMDPLPTKPFVTAYRGTLMVLTCICILAVDFPVFPRRFAKTEAFGTSVMDMGVGSFVFAAGIVAARQQLKEQASPTRGYISRIKGAIKHSLPVLALGLIRLQMVKGLEYAEHVSEYGVHWNFFFTLALLGPVIAVIQPLLNVMPSYGLLAFVIAVCYELVLYLPEGVKVYIILAERKPGDWFSQNREGVVSLAGYLAIFIAGMGIGMGIMPRDPGPELPEIKKKDILDEDEEWLASILAQHATESGGDATAAPVPEIPFRPEFPKTTWFHLFKWTFIWFILSVWAMWRYGPGLYVSRRMANLAYVIWVCAFNTFQLFTFRTIERIMFPDVHEAKDDATEKQRIREATSPVLHAFNRNGLAIFLLANLLTGGINMSVKTWHMGDMEAMTILVGYIGVVCATALVLDKLDISIKI